MKKIAYIFKGVTDPIRNLQSFGIAVGRHGEALFKLLNSGDRERHSLGF